MLLSNQRPAIGPIIFEVVMLMPPLNMFSQINKVLTEFLPFFAKAARCAFRKLADPERKDQYLDPKSM